MQRKEREFSGFLYSPQANLRLVSFRPNIKENKRIVKLPGREKVRPSAKSRRDDTATLMSLMVSSSRRRDESCLRFGADSGSWQITRTWLRSISSKSLIITPKEKQEERGKGLTRVYPASFVRFADLALDFRAGHAAEGTNEPNRP